MKGIDVSTLQGVVDFGKVRTAGYEFAMIKATQGRGEGAATRLLRRFTDGKFKRNIEAAAKAGLACGVYHYMTAKTVTEAEEEAEYFCAVIAPYRDRITLWAAVDVESEMHLFGIAPTALRQIVFHFMQTVKRHGYKPMLYTNPNYLKYKLPAGAFDESEIWLAHHGVRTPMSVPNTRMWQSKIVGNATDVRLGNATSAEGRIYGISSAPCDVNEGYFSPAIPAICRLAARGVIDSPTYWCEHYADVRYLDELLIKAEAKITGPCESAMGFEAALARLIEVGIINSPEYWRGVANKIRFVSDLICKLGGAA